MCEDSRYRDPMSVSVLHAYVGMCTYYEDIRVISRIIKMTKYSQCCGAKCFINRDLLSSHVGFPSPWA